MVGVKWFTEMTRHAEWCTFDKRIEFVPPGGIKASGSTLGNVLAVFGFDLCPRWAGIRSASNGQIVFNAGW